MDSGKTKTILKSLGSTYNKESLLYPYSRKDKDLFKGVEYIVQANANEQYMFWAYNFFYKNTDVIQLKSWVKGEGLWLRIGELDERPICIDINYGLLNNKKVMFYTPSSQLVDHEMVDLWIFRYAKTINRCNSSNFSNCIRYLSED